MKSILLLILLTTTANAQNSTISQNNQTITAVPNSTVGSLPVCNAANNGNIRNITDSLTPAVGVAIVGGGAVATLVHCNGSAWIVG